MIVTISEHSLMGKYSFVGCRILILYDIIDRRYVATGNFILFVTFTTLIYLKD